MDHNDNAVALLINRYKTSLNAPVLVTFITPEISQNVTIQVGWVIFAPFKVSPSCVWTQSGVDSNTTVTEAEKEHTTVTADEKEHDYGTKHLRSSYLSRHESNCSLCTF